LIHFDINGENGTMYWEMSMGESQLSIHSGKFVYENDIKIEISDYRLLQIPQMFSNEVNFQVDVFADNQWRTIKPETSR
jgi:hypothetical protein